MGFHVISVLAARCPMLSGPAFGSVSVTGRSIGDNATYSCDPGFDLVGTAESTCEQVNLGTARWSGIPPICQRKFLLYVTLMYM